MAEPGQIAWMLLPLVLGGICNMAYVRLPTVRRFNAPLDAGRRWRDGRPLLGGNKTWQGLAGMTGFTALWMTAMAWLHGRLGWAPDLAVIDYAAWRLPWEALAYGALWGLTYAIAELPNSFAKRRLRIGPGTTGRGRSGRVFAAVDHLDSVVGCTLILPVFHHPTLRETLWVLLLGTAFHCGVNRLLLAAGLKRRNA